MTTKLYRKILVTGGSGLLGTAARAMLGQYADREFILSDASSCDLTNLSNTVAYVKKNNPDAILHFAAVAGGIQLSLNKPATLLRDNVFMNFNVLEAARQCGVKKTILTLSAGMYPDNASLPLKEESIHDGPPHESNYSYSYAKRLIEPSIRAYATEYGMNVLGLVSNGIFGENGNFSPASAVMLNAIIRRFYEQRNSKDEVVVWGDGSPRREYTYSQDIFKAFMWCLDNYDQQQILNIGSTEEYSVKEIVEMTADLIGIERSRLKFDTSKPAGVFRKNTDNSKFVALSQFQYTPFSVGLERTVKWFCNSMTNAERIRL